MLVTSVLAIQTITGSPNPADSEQYIPMLKRHKGIFGRMPRQASADGGFASKKNLSDAKELKIKDVALCS